MGVFDVTSLFVWLPYLFVAFLFSGAGYLLARVRAVSLQQELDNRHQDLDKYKERLGEAEKRMEWLEGEPHVDPRGKAHLHETDSRTDYPLESIRNMSPSDIPDVTGGLGDSLEAFLRALSRNIEGCQAAVLADEQGLLVAGVGEYEENLAAIAAVCNEVGDRVGNILPFGKLQEMQMIDENGLAATIYFVPVDTQWLTLVLLSVGKSPGHEVVKQFIKDYLPEENWKKARPASS
uniref:Uncharacterized protein n=1 Tax=Candidatus Kentrum sp. FW TaxID=2126338 RepID=A0A450TCT6_9GAMM|nr:MAG: hypothetical protein BECKFW1821C_GA0114237_100645 [Candidatus Kentron sp. FW]